MHDDDGHDWNEGKPDHEGIMAAAQLDRISKISQTMLNSIGENDELEGWVQYKISRAYNDLTDIFTYIQFKSENPSNSVQQVTNDYPTAENEQELEEAKKKKPKGLWHNIWAKRKRGERPAKPGEKGYPKTLNIESKEFRQLIKDLLQQEIKR